MLREPVEGPARTSECVEDAHTFGFLTIGGIDVAMSLTAIREVVPRPAQLDDLFVTSPELLGAMNLRGRVVPVVDLRTRLGREAVAEATQNVVIISHAGVVFGLLAEELGGICSVPARDLCEVRTSDGAVLVSHTFLHPEHRHVVSVLDVDRLAAIPGLPLVASAEETSSHLAFEQDESSRKMTLFECGDLRVAVDVQHVHTMLPGAVPGPSALAGHGCLGATRYLDHDVAVVDVLQLLELGRLDDAAVPRGAGLVVAIGDGFVVMAVTAVLRIIEVTPTMIRPVDHFAVARDDLIEGLIDVDDHGLCYVVDADAVKVEGSMPSLAALMTPTSGTAGDSPLVSDDEDHELDRPADAGASFLVYEVTTGDPSGESVAEMATPLEHIDEIIPFPEDLMVTDGRAGVLGIMSHRDEAIPVVCLSSLIGMSRVPGSTMSSLLIVRRGDANRVAVAVQRLVDIAPLVWRRAGRDGQPVGSLVVTADSTHLRTSIDLRSVVDGLSLDKGTRAGRNRIMAGGESRSVDGTDENGALRADRTRCAANAAGGEPAMESVSVDEHSAMAEAH